MYVPILTLGHERRLVADKTRSWAQVAEVRFHRRVGRNTLRGSEFRELEQAVSCTGFGIGWGCHLIGSQVSCSGLFNADEESVLQEDTGVSHCRHAVMLSVTLSRVPWGDLGHAERGLYFPAGLEMTPDDPGTSKSGPICLPLQPSP